MKKLITLLLALTMALSLGLTAGAEEEVPTITVFLNPWVSAPLPDDDVYKTWLDETYGANFELILASDYSTELLTRFSSGDEPDIIIDGSMSNINTLYDEGVLIEDWNVYADQLPNTLANMSEEAKLYCSTEDGKLKSVPTAAGDQMWTFQIRKDWLENLGLEMPTTMEELLNVARAFTHDDPDGDGVANTYGFSSAGGGTSLGGDLDALLMGFGGHKTFYLTDDGEVSHPLLDGNYQKYLDFLTTVVNEGLIDPDWYTQAWNDRKPKTYNGEYGIVWYPVEALHTETEQGRGSDGAVLDWYDLLILESGVVQGPGLLGNSVRTVSAACAEDEAKMAVICRLFEDTALGQDNYYVLRYGVGIDNFEALHLDNGFVYINANDTTLPHQHNSETSNSTWNWGILCCSYADNYIGGETKEPSALAEKVIELSARWYEIPQMSGEYKLLDPDATLASDSANMMNEFALSYIMGTDKDYDGFVQRWLSAVGNDLVEDARTTWQHYGLIG